MMWLLAVYLFAAPLFFLPTSTDARYSKLLAALIGLCLLGVAWGIRAAATRRWELRIPWIALPALLLVAVMALSAIPAAVPCVVLQGILVVIAFAALAILVGDAAGGEDGSRWPLLALTGSAAVASLLGILQFTGVASPSGGSGPAAMLSLLGTPQALGGFVALSVFPGTLLMGRGQPQWLRLLAAGLLAVIVVAASLLNSLTVTLALAAGSVVFLVGGLMLGRGSAGRRWRLILAGLLLIALLAGGLAGLWSPETAPSTEEGRGTGVALRILGAHPLLGVGLGQFKLRAGEFSETGSASLGVAPMHAGSEFVHAGAELGALGLVAVFLAVVGLVLFFVRSIARQSDPATRMDAVALLSGLVVFLVLAAGTSPAHRPASSLALMVILGVATSARFEGTAWRRIVVRGSVGVLAGVLVLGIAVTGIVFAARDLTADGLLRHGTAQLQGGLTAEADATLSRSIALDFCPRQAYFYRATARLYAADRLLADGEFGAATQQYDAARQDLDRCQTRFPEPEVFLAMANLGLRLEEPELLDRGVEGLLARPLLPELRAQALYLDGLRAKRSGEVARAEAVLRGLIEAHPAYVRSYIALGDLLRDGGSADDAETLYQRALELAEQKLAEAEAQLVEGAVLPTSEFARWARQRAEALEEIDVASRALSSYEVPIP
jgi:hypothetical protein